MGEGRDGETVKQKGKAQMDTKKRMETEEPEGKRVKERRNE